MNTENRIDHEYNNFLSAIVEYGSLDIRTAITTALEVEEGGDWVAEVVREYGESIGIPLMSIDIVSAVYDDILQTSRNEIDDLINFDFSNDDADIYIAGNYCATSYDWSDNANETIKDKLIGCGIKFADLSVKCQWFLNQIEANY